MHFYWSAGHFKVDSFSTPFFVAALLGQLTLLAALHWLPESLPKTTAQDTNPARDTSEKTKTDWRILGGVLFIWQPNAPYFLSGVLLIALDLSIAWKVVVKHCT
jgi:hypothetical protein